MAELKIGGSDVKSLMYRDKDVSGSQMLKSGTILYISGQDVSTYNNELSKPNSTAKIIFPSVGKHWEGLKKY